MGVREAKVERYLDAEVKKLGGVTRKYVSPGHDGVADRLCFLPGGLLFLVEVKTVDGRLSHPQKREHQRMVDLGFRSYVAYGEPGVDALIKHMKLLLADRAIVQKAIDNDH